MAIKRLTKEKDGDHESLKNEALMLANLRHPNIVSVFDVAADENGLLLVMELIEGEDLSSWLEGEALSLDDFQQLGVQTLEALLAAHELKVLHRDMKPENIRVSRLPGGRLTVKVMDFGLARASSNARRQTTNLGGQIKGSIRYMAPEQIEHKPMDGRADLYALACVFYKVLSGRTPFNGDTIPEIIEAHLEQRVRPLQERCPDLHEDLCAWVMWTINRKPEDRPANAREALDSFNGVFERIKAGQHITRAIETGVVHGHTDSHTAHVPTQRTQTALVPPVQAAVPEGAAPSDPEAEVSDSQFAPPESSPTSEAKRGMSTGLLVGAAAVVLGGAAFMLWPRGESTAQAAPSTPAPASSPVAVVEKSPVAVATPPPVEAATESKKPSSRREYEPVAPTVSASRKPLPNADRILARYVSTDHLMRYADPASPKKTKADVPALATMAVSTWMDIAEAGGNRPLAVIDRNILASPRMLVVLSPELREPTPCLVFEGGEYLRATYSGKSADGATLNPKDFGFRPGYSLVLVARVRSGTNGTRLAALRGFSSTAGERGSFQLFYTADKKLLLESSIGGVAQPAIGTKMEVPENAFLVITITLSQSDKKARIFARGARGEAYQSPSIQLEADLPSLNEFTIGKLGESPESKEHPEQTSAIGADFKGDLAEVVVYRSALNREGAAQLEDLMIEHYFAPKK